VRLARLTSARTWDCLARLSTDGLRFFTFVVAPCAIQFSSCSEINATTLSEAQPIVNGSGKSVLVQFGSRDHKQMPAPRAGGLYKNNCHAQEAVL
jgi:hypothetical protein